VFFFLYEPYVKCGSARNVGENFVVNFPKIQFQAKHASINSLMRSSLLGHFRTRNLAKINRVLTDEKLDEVGARLEYI
jgi:hypothetical protein